MTTVILLSGEIATGKSAVAKCLVKDHAFRRASTGTYLMRCAKERKLQIDRDTLKIIGDTLDLENNGRWVADLVFEQSAQTPGQCLWLLDSIRRDFQIRWFRDLFSMVVHVHLTASEEICRQRYELRRREGGEYDVHTSYDEAKAGPTEHQVRSLAKICDLLVDTGNERPEDLAKKIVKTVNKKSSIND